ncbi:hypothetical protein [Brevibacillus borstelensis]|uniref:hypothetical protein n=1 Tax=Brevibacillus borstelensis TaxID=45462 RepID=UPI0030C48446
MNRAVRMVLSTTLVLGLAASVLSVVQTPAAGKSEERAYLIAYKNDLPSGFEERIEESGGSVETAIDEIGIVSAIGLRPSGPSGQCG